MRSLAIAAIVVFTQLVLGLCSSSALANIRSVIVYPDRASVTRMIEVDVQTGAGTLALDNLPANILRNSVRISATGPSGLQLGSSEFSTRRGIDRVNPQAQALSEHIRNLQDQQAALDDRLQARQMQLTLLHTLANQSDREQPLNINELEQTLRLVGESADEILNQQRTLNLQKRDLIEQLQRLERELADLGQQQRDTTVLNVSYNARSAGRAEFQIEYVVPQAYWRPVYEWRLNTQTAQLEMVQSAIVQQNTGEDWSEVSLSVSLSRPSAGGQLPEPQPWWIGVAEPTPEQPAPMAEADMLQPMQVTGQRVSEEAEAVLAGTEYNQHYQIAGLSSVRTDNQERRFRLDSHALDVQLSARSVPIRQTQAWLYVEGIFNGEAALPPGVLTLYQDGALTGQNYFEGIRPGAALATSFGVDDRIEIEYELQQQTRASEGVIRRSTQQIRQYKITARNRHNRPIELTLLDRIPVSTDERIKVELTRDTTAPDQRDVDDRPGVLAWELKLNAGDSQELTIGYSVTYPEEIEYLTGW